MSGEGRANGHVTQRLTRAGVDRYVGSRGQVQARWRLSLARTGARPGEQSCGSLGSHAFQALRLPAGRRTRTFSSTTFSFSPRAIPSGLKSAAPPLAPLLLRLRGGDRRLGLADPAGLLGEASVCFSYSGQRPADALDGSYPFRRAQAIDPTRGLAKEGLALLATT